MVVEGWDNEKNESQQETDGHHMLTAIEFVVDQKAYVDVSKGYSYGTESYLLAR